MKHIPFLLLLLSLSHSLQAQSGPRWYYNINESNVAIEGYDLVAYHTNNTATQGIAQFASNYKGITYLFSSDPNKVTFEKDPEQYLPAFGGWCTYFMGIDQTVTAFPPTRMPSNPKSFQILNGRLYLFRKTAQQDFGKVFESSDTEPILERANAFWKSRETYATGLNEKPEGLNAMARMENLEWQPFMGKWQSEVVWWNDTTGTATSSFKGEWTFAYGYDGYCIMDNFKGIPDLPYAGTQNGPAVRGFDVLNNEWHMTYIPVNQPRAATWLMTGNFVGKGHLEGALESKDPFGNEILQKIVFKLISPDHFQWKAHWSWDGGKTWKENAGFSESRRIE